MSRRAALKAILFASIVSTAIHYAHNVVEVDQYPRSDVVSPEAIQIGAVILWPLLTAIGLLGYRLYSQRRYQPAHLCLAVYSATGISTLGHFIDGNPDIAPPFYATLFTDALTGFAVLAFTLWSIASAGNREPVDERPAEAAAIRAGGDLEHVAAGTQPAPQRR